MLKIAARSIAAALLWALIALALAATLLPAFLDRIYYEGPPSDHFDGARFENPDGAISFPPRPGQPRGNILTRFLLGSDDRPPWPEQVPVQPGRPPARVTGDQTMLATWVGHSTVLVQAGGLNILTDPIWSDYASPLPPLGPRRVAAPGVRFEHLPRIDIVVVSHNHYDHMDLPTLKRLWQRDRPLIVTSLGNETILRNAGMAVTGLDWGESIATKGARVHVARNHHWSSRWGKDRNRALWSAFFIETGAGNIFFAGDTGAGDMRWPDEARRIGPVRLALLPIGAFRFTPGQMETGSHIGPLRAVEIFRRLDAAAGLAVHWGTFRLSYEAWDTPPRMLSLGLRCAGLAPDAFRALRHGETMAVPSVRENRGTGNANAGLCAPDSPEMRRLR